MSRVLAAGPVFRALHVALVLAVMSALCCGLAACGKIGDPSPPGPPDKIIYPKFYPTK